MKNIRLSDFDFLKLVPSWMRSDPTCKSLAKSIELYVHDFVKDAEKLKKWAAIETLTESELDELAWEWNVVWYLPNAPIGQKRDIIKTAPLIMRKIGTKWAVEQVLSIYFTSAKVKEWFQYNGTEGHFKITTSYPELHNNTADFIRVLNLIKRYSQLLDGVELISPMSTEIYAAGHLRSRMTNSIVLIPEFIMASRYYGITVKSKTINKIYL